MPDCIFDESVEDEVAKVSMRIKAAKIGVAQVHEYFERVVMFSGIAKIVGFRNWIRKRIVVCIPAWYHLLHYKSGADTAGGNRLRPVFEGLSLFSPVMLCWIPRANVFKPERNQIEYFRVNSCRDDIS